MTTSAACVRCVEGLGTKIEHESNVRHGPTVGAAAFRGFGYCVMATIPTADECIHVHTRQIGHGLDTMAKGGWQRADPASFVAIAVS